MRHQKLLPILLVILIALSTSVFASATENPNMAKVIFKVSEPDASGYFRATLTVHNATFNAFQFAFSYNKEAISPVDNTGKVASAFSSFGIAAETTSTWMNPIGNKLDIQQGLLECGGYANPGSGSVTADSSGMLLYTFTFRKIGNDAAAIKLATENSGGPFDPSIAQGGGLAEAGYNVDAKIEIQLPSSLGQSITEEIVTPISDTPPSAPVATDPKAVRLQGTVILQIDNGAATKNGTLVRVDKNVLVKPYIDINNRTMVPVRFLAESLGGTVDWDGLTQLITINYNGKKILMTVGSTEYSINNVVKVMDTVPVINKGWDRTMVPARFVAEAFGMDVKWDPVERLVIISPISNPWNPEGAIEKEVLPNLLLLFSPLMRDFV